MATDDQQRWATASAWASALPAPTPGRAPDRRVEVAVVGGGLAGLLSAVVLEQAGVDVVVLERHGIGGVTTRGSTGKLTALQGAMASTIAQLRDPSAAAGYSEAAMFGVSALRELIGRLGIDCSLQSATDHTYATEPDALTSCAEQMAAATAAGLPVRWVEETELPFPVSGAVCLDDQAHLDPGALAAGLARHLGPRVAERCPVEGVHEQPGGVELTLAGGQVLTADRVLIATLGPVHDPALLATRCEARRSYAIAAPHPSPPEHTYISLDASSRSIRPAMVDGQPMVVVGGEGHVMGEPGDTTPQQRWDALARFATDALGAGPAAYRWVAHDLIPSDGVPFIGWCAPGAERTWVASGFQKWGISTSMVAADLLLADLEGRSRPWAEVFDPRRLADSVTTKLAKDAARSVRHLVVDPIRDRITGEDHAPRCSHLGCSLSFDSTEQTWDCPCHGSRFDRDGQVVCGPASSPVSVPADANMPPPPADA